MVELEARVGIEPTHKAFAEPCLTTWLPRRGSAFKIVEFHLHASSFGALGSALPIARSTAQS